MTFADGSAISGLANFVWKDSTTGAAADVTFAYQAGGAAKAGLLPVVADGAFGGWDHLRSAAGQDHGHAPDAAPPLDVDHLLFNAMNHHDWHV